MRHRALFRKVQRAEGSRWVDLTPSGSWRRPRDPPTAPARQAEEAPRPGRCRTITPSCTSSRKSTRTRFPAISDRASHFLSDRRKSRAQEDFIPPFQTARKAKKPHPPGNAPDPSPPEAMWRCRDAPDRNPPRRCSRSGRSRRPPHRDAPAVVISVRMPQTFLPPDRDIIRPFDPHSRGTESRSIASATATPARRVISGGIRAACGRRRRMTDR